MVDRPKLSIKPPSSATADEIFANDVANLMENPAFRRFMLTVFETAGMYTSSFHSEAGASHYAEGRRSLGFDMLRTLQQHAGDDAHIRIMSEVPTLGGINDRRNDDYDRNRDLDDGEPVDRKPDPEPGVLQY